MQVDLVSALRQEFGLKRFRPGQKKAIRSLLGGRDALVVMPTGYGKSLIFQLAGVEMEGLTVVISPLIALMKDQVDSLRAKEIPATVINSSLSEERQRRRLRGLAKGKYKLVYVAPERLRSAAFRAVLRKANVTLLAVDEAHCICQWGHDFRPDYMLISGVREELDRPVTVALTAAATPAIRKAILRHLRLTKPCQVVTGFDRPNLTYEVQNVDSGSKGTVLRRLLSRGDDGGMIVYVGTRKQAERVTENLRAYGTRGPVCYYHAGLEPRKREAIHSAFTAGTLPVVVATNAFGLGIDRPDVRMVVHYTMPGSLEAYYQEAGRAGRDGKPARAVLLYRAWDRDLQEYLIEQSTPTAEEIQQLADHLRSSAAFYDDLPLWKLRREFKLPSSKLNVILAHLEAAGLVERFDDGQAIEINSDWSSDLLRAQIEQLDRQRLHRWKQLDQMVAYAEADVGHREILLAHFGQISPEEVPSSTPRRRTRYKHNRVRQSCQSVVPDSHIVTLQLWQKGFTPEEIAAERDLKVGTVWDHFARLIHEGKLEPSNIVSKKVERKVREVIERLGDCSRLRPIKEDLPDEVTYHEIRCVVAAHTP